MEYRRLGNSGLKVSEIGLGTGIFGGRVSEQDSVAIISKAIDSGVTFFDSADFYGNGRAEEYLGKAVRGKRDSVIIATKFGLPMGPGPNDHGASRLHIMSAVDASLKRLGTDYVDLYYPHWPDPATPLEEIVRTLNALVRSGKVRYIGLSNFVSWQLCEALWLARVEHLEPYVVVQARYNMIERGIETDYVPFLEQNGIGVVPWSPLAMGFLTGRYQRDTGTAGTRLAGGGPVPLGAKSFPSVLTEENFAKLEKWQKFAAERGHATGELAIAWLLAHKYVSSVITGASTVEHVSPNIAAAGWKLTEAEMAQL